MSLDTEPGYPGCKHELDALNSSYDSESFVRSILQVFMRDGPEAMKRLLGAIESGDLAAARSAIHSLANIMGVVFPVSSQALIEGISADLKEGHLDTAAMKAKELETMLQSVLVSIDDWLESLQRDASPSNKNSKDSA